MTTRRLLGWILVAVISGFGCGNNPDPFTDTGVVEEDAAVTDTGDMIDSGVDTGTIDSGRDTGTIDTGTVDTGRADTGTDGRLDSCTIGACPSTCTIDTDCDRCWGSCDTRSGAYCCVSGMCIYRAGTCGGSTEGGMSGGDGGEAGLDDGGADGGTEAGLDDAALEDAAGADASLD